jgi:hypothetical protein
MVEAGMAAMGMADPSMPLLQVLAQFQMKETRAAQVGRPAMEVSSAAAVRPVTVTRVARALKAVK